MAIIKYCRCVCVSVYVCLKGLTYLRWHIFRGLYSDSGVPLSRRQHSHLVQELINASH